MASYYLLLMLMYFSGRLFFSDMKNIIYNDDFYWKEFLWRSVYGVFLIFVCGNIGKFAILYLFLAIMITTDCIKKPDKFGSGYNYMSKMAFVLILAVFAVIIADKISLFANPLYLLTNVSQFNITKIFTVLTGYLVVLKEGTIIIRLVLNRIKAEPQTAGVPQQKDEEEYDRGKLIGILERTFIYFLILLNQIGAIAVIIALKSLARFKELDNKDFAEYFLIGSLLSLLTATLPAVVVNFILKNL